jgi:DUF971 family protein
MSMCKTIRSRGFHASGCRAVRLADIEPAGAYGLNLTFSDGHRRGIYPFEMLATMD